MKKYSQKELLSEGVWDAVKNTAKGAWRAGNYALKQFSPKTHSLLSAPKQYVTGMRDAIAGVPDSKETKVTPAIEQMIKAGLIKAGMKPAWRRIQYQSYDQASKRTIYSAYILDQNTGSEKMVYVDGNGNILQ